jgi:hypothetical protein
MAHFTEQRFSRTNEAINEIQLAEWPSFGNVRMAESVSMLFVSGYECWKAYVSMITNDLAKTQFYYAG